MIYDDPQGVIIMTGTEVLIAISIIGGVYLVINIVNLVVTTHTEKTIAEERLLHELKTLRISSDNNRVIIEAIKKIIGLNPFLIDRSSLDKYFDE